MIGVIQLVVEVNYDEMLKEDNLEAIHGYTGIPTADGMMKGHLNAIANKLTESVKGLPYVKYNIDGQFYPTPEQPQVEAVEEEVEVEDIPVPYAPEEMVEEVEPEQDKFELLSTQLDGDVDLISIEKGFIKAIKVNGEFYEYLKKEVLSDENPMSYLGFEIRIEGMEEPYEIEFEPFDGTELKTFSYKIDSQKS